MSTSLAERPAQAPETRTAQTMNVYRCIAAVSAEIAKDGISKDRSNAQQGYKFRGIDDVLNALAPIMAKHGLVVFPRMLSRDVVERQAKSGGVLFNVTVEAEYTFVSAHDTTRETVRVYGEAMDSADKATNKAMSAAYKYAAIQTFCIPTEGDNDADDTTHDVVAKAPAPTGVRPVVERENQGAATGENRGNSPALTIKRVDRTPTKKPGTTRYLVTLSTGEQLSTIKDALGSLCEQLMDDCAPVTVESEPTKWGANLVSVHRVKSPMPEIQLRGDLPPDLVAHTEPVDEDSAPF